MFTFDASYSWEILQGPPYGETLFRFGYEPDDSSTIGGLTVEFVDETDAVWFGLFGGACAGISGVFPTSDNHVALDIAAIQDSGLLVIATYTELVAYKGAECIMGNDSCGIGRHFNCQRRPRSYSALGHSVSAVCSLRC